MRALKQQFFSNKKSEKINILKLVARAFGNCFVPYSTKKREMELFYFGNKLNGNFFSDGR